MDELLARRWLETLPVSPDATRLFYSSTADGADALAKRGVVLPTAKGSKPIAFSCLDWTERRWHLGGALGRAIMDASVEAGYIWRVPESRVVELIGSLDRWLES